MRSPSGITGNKTIQMEEKLNAKDKIELLGRAGLKYIDEFGVEYFIDSEMIVNENYHFVLWSDSIEFFENYLKENQSDNISYDEVYDKNKKMSHWKN
jgi:hypothetical protein